MSDFLEHALQMPTIIPLGFMICVMSFFIVSLVIGANKDIDHGGSGEIDANHVHTELCDHSMVDISHDIHSDSGDVASSKGILYFLGIKSGVHTMSLLAFGSFLLFAVTFFLSAFIDLNSTSVRKMIGILCVIGLFPITNNIVYMLLKPIATAISKSTREPETIIGLEGKVNRVSVNKEFVFIQFEGWSEEQLIYLKEEDKEKVKVGDHMIVSEVRKNKDYETMFYGELI